MEVNVTADPDYPAHFVVDLTPDASDFLARAVAIDGFAADGLTVRAFEIKVQVPLSPPVTAVVTDGLSLLERANSKLDPSKDGVTAELLVAASEFCSGALFKSNSYTECWNREPKIEAPTRFAIEVASSADISSPGRVALLVTWLGKHHLLMFRARSVSELTYSEISKPCVIYSYAEMNWIVEMFRFAASVFLGMVALDLHVTVA